MSELADPLRTKIIAELLSVSAALSRRDDKFLKEIFRRSRVERDDVYRTMTEYGGTFGGPPSYAYDNIHIGGVDGSQSEFWLDAYLWNESGQETDLSIAVTGRAVDSRIDILIDDVRVM